MRAALARPCVAPIQGPCVDLPTFRPKLGHLLLGHFTHQLRDSTTAHSGAHPFTPGKRSPGGRVESMDDAAKQEVRTEDAVARRAARISRSSRSENTYRYWSITPRTLRVCRGTLWPRFGACSALLANTALASGVLNYFSRSRTCRILSNAGSRFPLGNPI